MHSPARDKCREVRLNHWKKWLSPDTGPRDVVAERMRPGRPLPDWVLKILPRKSGKVRILDLASGPLTALGTCADDLDIDLVAIEDLALPLDNLMRKEGLEPPVPLQFGTAEDVLPAFGKAAFDLIYSFSGLDFSEDPISAYRKLLKCLKTGGCIVTFHEHTDDPGRITREWFRYFHLLREGRLIIGQRGYFRDLQDALPQATISWELQKGLVRLEIRPATGRPPIHLHKDLARKSPLPPMISMHLPKTAGSSFRRFLMDLYGDTLRLMYTEEETAPKRIPQIRLAPEIRCLHGHFQANLFDSQLPEAIKVTWMRDPVERVVSSYFQFQRHPESARESDFNRRIFEQGLGLMDFARQPEMRRQIRWYFNAVPLDAFFFIGLTERYDESIRLLGHLLGRTAPGSIGATNLNPDKQMGHPYDLSDADRSQLEGLYAEEIELYRFVQYRFQVQFNQAFGTDPMERD